MFILYIIYIYIYKHIYIYIYIYITYIYMSRMSSDAGSLHRFIHFFIDTNKTL